MNYRYQTCLGVLLLMLWVVLAINPVDRTTWVLENVLVLVGVLVLLASFRRFRLSKISYTFIFIFLCLHLLGAHYTYSETPYEVWFQTAFGLSVNNSFGWTRNNFDRVMHFAYGLLLVYPMREVFLRIAEVKGFWGYFLPLDLTMSTTMIYELIEWGASVVFGDGGTAFLGTQGDVWDAQKDMVLGVAGGIVGMSIVLLINVITQRDFSREFIASLTVKDPQPLGEVALAERLSSGNRDQNPAQR